MKNIILIIFAFLGLFSTVGQEVSSYKYVIVPQEFEFLKEPNQYELNALAKFLFEKKGYVAVMEGEDFPDELIANGCKALVANLRSNSGLFSTKLLVTLKDCNNREVFVSEEGKSREKEFKDGFHEALREAMETLPERNDQAEVAEVVAQPEITKTRANKPDEIAESEVVGRPGVDTSGTANIPESEVVGRPEIDSMENNDPVKGEVEENLPSEVKENSQLNGKGGESKSLRFNRGNGIYILEPTGKGYNFYQEGMAEPFAALIKSSAGNSFIYSSINSKGLAQFDAQGNLVVEILNNETGSLDSIVYTRNH